MANTQLAEELSEASGGKVAVQEVKGGPDDPFSKDSSAASTAEPSSPPEGASQPEPAQKPPEEGQPAPQETPKAETPEATPPATDAPPAAETPPSPPQPSAEDLANLGKAIDEKANQLVRPIQSGLDRRMAGIQEQLEASEKTAAEQKVQMREFQTKGLDDAQKAELERRWAWEDRDAALDEREKGLNEFHDGLEYADLLGQFGKFGVTEEQLKELPFEERETFCQKARGDYFEQQQGTAQPPSAQEPPAATQPGTPAEQAAPAGASAPSDIGTGGTPPAPKERDEGKGSEAMAANIGDGWESARGLKR